MKEPAQSPSKSVKSMMTRITKISISEEIAKHIMDLISNGDLKPGQRLPSERELCEHFGACRSSLREALRCLSIVGILNAHVGEGTTVAVDGGKFFRRINEWRLITEKYDIENLLQVRIALEGLSAANTALHATQDEIDAAQKLFAKMKASLKDESQFAALDLEFHVMLANASGNTLLSDLISLIRNQLAKAMSKVLHLPDAIPLSLKEHSAILDAINRRDAEGARAAMQAHLNAALQRYSEATKEHPQPRKKTRGSSTARQPRARSANL